MRKIYSFLLLILSLQSAAQVEWQYLAKTYNLTSMAEEGNDIWISTYSGLIKLDKNSAKPTFYDHTNSSIPSLMVRKVVVDHQGIKWIGTGEFGIYRFDGTNWTDVNDVYTKGASIGNMVIDKSNNLWAAGDNGLLKYDGTTWSQYNTSNSNIPDNGLWCIHADSNTIWMQSTNGLTKFDGKNWTTYNKNNSNISAQNTLAILTDKKGNVWLVHPFALEKFDGKTFTLFDPSTAGIPTSNNHFSSAAIDSLDILRIATHADSDNTWSGILSFDGVAWIKQDTATNSTIVYNSPCILVDKSNNIWIGSNNDYAHKLKNGKWVNYNLSRIQFDNFQIKEIAYDTSGTCYVATGGLFSSSMYIERYKANAWDQINCPAGIGRYRLTTDRFGKLYLRTLTSDIYKWDGTAWISLPKGISNAPSQVYKAMAFDSKNDIWVDVCTKATVGPNNTPTFHHGVAHYDGTKWTDYDYTNSSFPDAQEIYAIKSDQNNNIWVATNNGLAMFNGSNWLTFTTSNSTLPTNNLKGFAIDKANNIWVCSTGVGFLKYDGKNWVFYSNTSATMEHTLEFDKNGDLLGITQNGSLQSYDGISCKTFDLLNSPLERNIISLAIDKHNNKWIGTTNGLYLFQKDGLILSSHLLMSPGKSEVGIFPNPAVDDLSVKLSQRSTIDILNVAGQSVKRVLADATTTTIHISDLTSGIYFVRVTNENGIEVHKIFKQ